jgi:pimeloyl-ACP methyl ester carboxylesterase
MAQRAQFVEFDVGDARLAALRWPGLAGAPIVIAAHGTTANAWCWDPLAHHLAGAAEVVAVDLRGRGRSLSAPAPFGIRRHADDLAAIAEQLGHGPVVMIGHSMGAFVVEMAAERHPAAVRDVVLVDGGTPLPKVAPDEVDETLHAVLGPVIDRIRTVWPDRVSYQAMWASHPAFVGGISSDLERNLLADLVAVDGGFRTATNEAAVRIDATELLTDDEVRTVLDRREQPATIVRAEFGMSGEPPGLIPTDVRDRYAQHRWIEAAGLNHYTVILGPDGARLVADVLRDVLTSP